VTKGSNENEIQSVGRVGRRREKKGEEGRRGCYLNLKTVYL
jgi:hypothetical protein